MDNEYPNIDYYTGTDEDGNLQAWVQGDFWGHAEVYSYSWKMHGVDIYVVTGDGFPETLVGGFDNAVLRMLEEVRAVLTNEDVK